MSDSPHGTCNYVRANRCSSSSILGSCGVGRAPGQGQVAQVQIGDDGDGNHNEAVSRMHRASRVAGAGTADSEDICSSLVLYVWNYSDKPLPCLIHDCCRGCPHFNHWLLACLTSQLNTCRHERQTSFICPYQVYGETIEQLLSLCWITGTSPTVYECNTSSLLFVLL
ncbi:uncharacterized protein [Lolium perenne]|uniref:uncharacterized protein isoform X2 n=1 Tax=Lolium perenne TaxID=4522 RepID=UPI0021F54641|nr:uncharacterized protein LOC127310326 isoform X2 [Lolium perenne]